MPAAPKKDHHAAKRPASTMTLTKRVFLFLSTLVPVLAIGAYQFPAFVVSDTLCAVSERILPQDAALELAKEQYSNLRRQPSLFGTAAYNRTMHWGTYRPNVLMGIKNRVERPLLFGIAWYDTQGAFDVRHSAVESDKLVFRWELHDGEFFGAQRVVDIENRAELLIDFVKTPDGTGWDVRVTCRRYGGSRPLTFVVYFAHEGGAAEFPLTLLPAQHPADSDAPLLTNPNGQVVGVSGFAEGPQKDHRLNGGRARIPFRGSLSDSCTNSTNLWEAYTFARPRDQAWEFDIRRTKGRHTPASAQQPSRTGAASSSSNVVVFKKMFASEFRVHVCLRELGGRSRGEAAGDSLAAHTQPLLSPCQLTRLASFHKAAFEEKFERLFLSAVSSRKNPKVTSTPALQARWAFLDKHVAELQQMTSSALSNMIGGMGFWHGTYLVVSAALDERSDEEGQFVTSNNVGAPTESETKFAATLFSGVPSRAKFPRGFLWDEGFHQLLMSRWNGEIGKDVIAHWLLEVSDPNTGWIPREQILGKESRSRVPREFTAQHPQHANPPSMVLAVQNLALSPRKTAHDVNFLLSILPRLTAWRDWFHASQCGGQPTCQNSPRPFPSKGTESFPNASVMESVMQYRWRSRSGFHLLACGLDDYPRPVCFADGRPSSGGSQTTRGGLRTTHRDEKHVDLMSWMAMMTETIRSIEIAAHSAHPSTPKATEIAAGDEAPLPWEDLLIRLHWDEKNGRFSDVTGCPKVQNAPPRGDRLQGAPQKPRGYAGHFSPYTGYVNLFPFLSLTVNKTQHALAILRLARDELNTPFGLASLSLASRALLAEYGQKHENYWAGPIWLNINYLFLRALKLKYIDLLGSEAEAFYHELRSELLANVLRQYVSTSKLWENYHWETGKGQGTAPFTGWTALIVLILGEQY